MPTIKQKRVAKLIIENQTLDKPKTDIEILKSSNYSTTTAETKSTKIINSEGVKEALNDYGFNEDNAKSVVASILNDETKDANARLKASDMVFKVHGTYAPEKRVTANIDLTPNNNKDTEDLAQKYEEELIQKYLGTPRTDINT